MLRASFLLFLFIVAGPGISQTFEELQREAQQCFEQKDYDCTVKQLKKALKKEPRHGRAASAWSDIGTSLRRMDSAREAMEAYDKAIAIAPEDPGILSNRASLKRQMKDYKGSLADHDEVIRLDPMNSDAYMERSNTKNSMGDVAGAEADLAKAVELDPNNFKAATNLALLKKRAGRHDEALVDLTRIIEKHPKQVIPYNNRADLIMTMGGDLQEAMKDIDKALELDPQYSNGYITRAEIWLAMGKKPEAKADLERAVELGESRDEFKDLFAQCE